MKRRIFLSLCLVAVGAVLLTGLVTSLMFYRQLYAATQSEVQKTGELVAASINGTVMDEPTLLKALERQFGRTRVTLLAPDGTVLYDSNADIATMENHSGRPEFEAAVQNGSASTVRSSSTLGENTYYYAKRLDNGMVLRAASTSRNIAGLFLQAIPYVAAIFALIALGCVLLSSSLTKRLISPIEKMADRARNEDPSDYYEELTPFIFQIKSQNEQIEAQMRRLQSERDTISSITENMREGLILIDSSRQVLSVNQSALSLLGAPSGGYLGKNILTISRDPRFYTCASRAISGESCDVILPIGRTYLHLFASPGSKNDGSQGAIILILDVTARQNAEKMRREFTANVSHELKTPLTSISGFSEMIQGGMVKSKEEVLHFASRIHREAERLINLIDDILRLSQIEESGARPSETVDLYEICKDVAASLEYAAAQNHVALYLTGRSAPLSADSQMIHELVFNLCDNAIKYNHAGGKVDLLLQNREDSVLLSVADTGIGIPKDQQDRVFERFYRVDKSRSKKSGGTGLGLSIVKHIVEFHHGSIRLASEPGLGSTIDVILPKSQPGPPLF